MSTAANPTTTSPGNGAAVTPRLTAEEFVERFGDRRADLVRGVVVETPMLGSAHGKICYRVALLFGQFIEEQSLGHVMINDTTVVVARDPDTARGADVLFVRYERLPRDALTSGPLTVRPDLIVEVRSPSERWIDLLEKVAESLQAGVTVVLVLDPPTRSATVYRSDRRQEVVEAEEALTLPDILPGFSVRVGQFFE